MQVYTGMLPCLAPFMASNYANSYLVPISFWMLTMPWIFFSDLAFQACISFYSVLDKVAPECFCLVRLKMPFLSCSAAAGEGTKLDWTYFKQCLKSNIKRCLAVVIYFGRRDRPPPPRQDSASGLYKGPPAALLQDPSLWYFTTKISVVRPFSVLRKDEIGPQ